MIDLNKFYERFQADPDRVKKNLVMKAIDVIFENVYPGPNLYNELVGISYSEITEACDWPDFQDNGIFEQAINIAVDTVLQIHGFKPVHASKYFTSNSPKS